ncbi:dynein axonemal assembly factor 4-like isoform X2 [Physella acuta]|uniref:dynein axonemal assembly factor 4-like isoform X2 n=1 Tax=Physella acuta TaxID=109671 RepID=UPI0027DCF46A|nr:dynein axonemal assembly factor 4-like isoform X2 [Physella acuta]
MPLIVKDFHWEQSEIILWITIPLKGVKANKVDIILSDNYLKVSFPPYLFECFLAYSVDDNKGSAEVGNGVVLFTLYKQVPKIWESLTSPDASNTSKAKEIREEAQKRIQHRFEKKQTELLETKREHGKLAINEMMKIEEEDRQRIEQIKVSERLKATKDLEKWKNEQKLLTEQEKSKLLAQQYSINKTNKLQDKNEGKKQKRTACIFVKHAKEGQEPPRENGKITVTHTPRIFPTPTRESQVHQEEEWLKKQSNARQAIQQSLDNDLTEQEKNPQWLQDKGNSFFAAGDFKSAANVYTHAIHLTPKLAALYSNRAACHLKMRNFFKCIEDCSKAMDLLFPPVPQNAASRCKALIRRGTAFCHLEMYVEGLRDYECALHIDPNNTDVAVDAERIRKIIQSTDDIHRP